MRIESNVGERQGRFIAREGSEQLGLLVFLREDDALNLVHTEVEPAHQGGGVGKALVNHAVDYARQNNVRLIPSCPYAEVVLRRRREELGDLVWWQRIED